MLAAIAGKKFHLASPGRNFNLPSLTNLHNFTFDITWESGTKFSPGRNFVPAMACRDPAQTGRNFPMESLHPGKPGQNVWRYIEDKFKVPAWNAKFDCKVSVRNAIHQFEMQLFIPKYTIQCYLNMQNKLRSCNLKCIISRWYIEYRFEKKHSKEMFNAS